ncbi:hypothetical protein Fcan01_08673 [Folsomia candida]|uniref:Uncharacterized protein n=1 Tax=Folsomia candida TaxID=158441 RepID=A0A226EFQ8_FOLCA|nr:hypothetical protein Fcan01_08673 [Folsomia candida]
MSETRKRVHSSSTAGVQKERSTLSPDQDHLVVSKSRFKNCFTTWFSPIFESFYLFCALSVVRKNWKNKCIGKTAEGGMILSVIVLMNILSFGVNPNATAMSVINSDLKLTEKFRAQDFKKIRTDHYLEGFMMISSIVGFASAFINLGRVIVDHCAPPFLGAYFFQCSPCSGRNPEVNCVALIVILVADFYFVFTILHKGFFYLIHVVFATTGRMVDYLEIIRSSSSDNLHIYKALQILEAQLNDYVRLRVMPAFISLVPVIEVLSLFVIIKLHGQVPLPGFLLFPQGFITTGSALIVYETVAAILNTKSAQTIGKWGQQEIYRGKVKRREVRSLRSLMVKFGANYIDKGTPLVTQNFCVSQTVSMLLMKRQ